MNICAVGKISHSQSVVFGKAKKKKKPPEVYIAGPWIFLPDAFEKGGIMDKLKALTRKAGLKPVTPFDENPANTAPKGITPRELAKLIAEADYKLAKRAKAVIANLTPWPPDPDGKHENAISADPGTVAEAAYAVGLNRPVFTHATVSQKGRTYAARIVNLHKGVKLKPDGTVPGIKRSADKMMVDVTGQFDNLMLPELGPMSGGSHNTVVVRDSGKMYTDLSAFKKALKDARAYFDTKRKPKRKK